MQAINQDILNFFRFVNHGVDIAHMQLNSNMDESIYNAVAMAQANPSVYDASQWVNSPEWQQAEHEYIVSIIGSNFTVTLDSFVDVM